MGKCSIVSYRSTGTKNIPNTYNLNDACAHLNALHEGFVWGKTREKTFHLDIVKVLAAAPAEREEWWASISKANPAEQAREIGNPPDVTFELQ